MFQMKVKGKSFAWAFFLTIMIFRDALAEILPAVGYVDEIMALAGLAYFLMLLKRKKLRKDDFLIAGVVVLLCILGFMGNYFSGVQNSLKYQVFDAFNIFKYIMVVWGALYYFEHYSTKEYLIDYLSGITKLTVVISTFFMLLNLFADIGMHTDYRWGLRTFHFIFGRVGEFYNACILWLIILTAQRFRKKDKTNFIFILLVLLNMCATVRTRTMAFAVSYLLLYYFLTSGRVIKLKWWHIILFALVLIPIGKDQIDYYLMTEDRARSVLWKYGFVTAKDYFPLGAGFGTYGTAVARDTYSALYREYNFGRYWGLMEENYGLLTDNFWPAIMGEFGFFGVVLTVILIYLVFRKLISATDNMYSRLCVYFAMGTLAIASIAASSFFVSARLMLFVCMVCRLDYSNAAETKLVADEKHVNCAEARV